MPLNLDYSEYLRELSKRDGAPPKPIPASHQPRTLGGRFQAASAPEPPAAVDPQAERCRQWTVNLMPQGPRDIAMVLARRAKVTLPGLLERLIMAEKLAADAQDHRAWLEQQAVQASVKAPPEPPAEFASFGDPMVELRVNSLNSLSAALRETRLLAEAANVAVPAALAEAAMVIVAAVVKESRGRC